MCRGKIISSLKIMCILLLLAFYCLQSFEESALLVKLSLFLKKKQLASGNSLKMQGNLPKFEFWNVFEDAELVKKSLLFFSFTESSEKKKKKCISERENQRK